MMLRFHASGIVYHGCRAGVAVFDEEPMIRPTFFDLGGGRRLRILPKASVVRCRPRKAVFFLETRSARATCRSVGHEGDRNRTLISGSPSKIVADAQSTVARKPNWYVASTVDFVCVRTRPQICSQVLAEAVGMRWEWTHVVPKASMISCFFI